MGMYKDYRKMLALFCKRVIHYRQILSDAVCRQTEFKHIYKYNKDERRWAHATPEQKEAIMALESKTDLNTCAIDEMIELAIRYMCPCHDGERALNVFNVALERAPENTEIMYWTAYCLHYELLSIEANKRAKALVEEIININTNNLGEAYQLLPSILLDLRSLRKHDAIDLYEESVRIEPKWVSNRYFLGMEYKNIGQIDKALYQFEQALSNIEENTPAFMSEKEEVFESEITGRFCSISTRLAITREIDLIKSKMNK